MTRNSSRVSVATSSESSSMRTSIPRLFLRSAQKSAPSSTRRFPSPGSSPRSAARSGFALAPDAGTTAELLYERADYALYHAKARYRGQPVIFSREHEVEIRKLSTIEHTLRRIDLDAELSLHFQPIVNVGTARLVGFEALARWHNPELGDVPPDVFISVAERTELIGTITQVLLRKALAAARSWPEDIFLSFNLSMRDLISQVTILQTVALIESSGIDPRRIIIEVTETALMQDYEQVQDSLRILRSMGLKVALDDFGSGQSSLSYVHQLSLDKIKIDRGFIRNIATQENARNIVKTVIDLCRNLKFDCVVEGVETAEQVEIISRLGCSTMQGYFFAKPMPQSEVETFIANYRMPDNPRMAAAAG